MADPRAILTLLLLLFILFSPSPSPEQTTPSARHHYADILAREHADLDLLNTTSFASFDPSAGKWLNITGLEQDTGFAWELLEKIKSRSRVLSTYALGIDGVGKLDGVDHNGRLGDEEHGALTDSGRGDLALYKNVSGVVHGEWVRSPLQAELKPPRLNMSLYEQDGVFAQPLGSRGFGRNLTQDATAGSVRVVFEERDLEETVLVKGANKMLREVRANINIISQDTGDDWEAQVHGVHFLDTGHIVMATTSEKFAGIFALPHMVVSDYHYGLAQEQLNQSLATVLREQEEGLIHGFNPWSSTPEGQGENIYAPTKCDLVLYLQQHPVALPASTLPLIESELREPTGAFPPPPSDMRFSLLAFSPDCGYVLESKGPPDYVPQGGNHLVGLKVEVEYLRARQHILIFSLALFGQILLLVRQMRDASTPSTRSRISLYTVALLAMGDGFTTMALCLASLFVQSVWVPLIGTAFLSFMSVSFFGMRFLLDIHTVQAPERERAERSQREADAARRAAAVAALAAARERAGLPPISTVNQPAATTAAPATAVPGPPYSQLPIITAAGVDTLPVPATEPRPTPATPSAPPPPPPPPIDTGAAAVFIPSDQDITQPTSPTPDTLPTTNTTGQTAPAPSRAPGFGALYTRFYFALLATLFLSLNASSWPSGPRRVYFTLLGMFYLSLWIPQISRNIQRNCRRALRWDFVAGQSLLRLVPFVYFYGYGKNVLFAESDGVGLALLAGWVWIQVCVLGSQELLGPRWFLPKVIGQEWVPQAYDYHPILKEDEEGGNLPIGATEAFAEAEAGKSSPVEGRRKSFSGAGENRGNGKRVFDCAICMGDLEVPVFNEGVAGRDLGGLSAGGLMLERRRYMVTPCRHIFHSGCLEGWMKYRLQCPVCREELPPV